ncbi:PRD domain-containing protein [Anaerobranca gottschalkii]|uniref:PRD domain-containing protein n=1 Tax=Anaerobranca gottschalkii DSM 13577 TaxID=1120990 RepID=A0A1H9ZQC9_9FIRM|nr:PRD domain-containing protein [Anaerobranca gottschalkii]SES83914.1 PRD domain-containing protein [Anaerobranca gottschalkii DSM 13577]
MWLQEMEEKFLPLVSTKDKEQKDYLISLLKKVDESLAAKGFKGLTFFHSVTLYNHLANLCTRGILEELDEGVFGDLSKKYPQAYEIAESILSLMEEKFPGVNQKGERQHLTILLSDLTKVKN